MVCAPLRTGARNPTAAYRAPFFFVLSNFTGLHKAPIPIPKSARRRANEVVRKWGRTDLTGF